MESSTVTTDSVEVARSEVARVFCPHRLTPQSGVRDVRLRLTARKVGGVAVVDLDYGRAVRIEPGPLGSFFLVQMPVQGSAAVRHGAATVTSTAATASVLSPYEPSDMQWGAHTPHRIFYAARASVQRELEKLLGESVDRPVRFDASMSMRTPAARSWARGVDFLADELAEGGDACLVDHPHVARRFEEALIGKLLLTHRHTYSDRMAVPAAHSNPSRLVRRACALMRDHHDERLTVGDVAEALGVSIRTLQECFRRELDTTITTYLRSCRLDAVHAALAAGGAETSVTAVALEHGFAHMGRFAGEYRARFGESPSATLRR